MKTEYVADDGRRFETKAECEAYEAESKFDGLADLSLGRIQDIPRTAAQWNEAPDDVRELAALFEQFASVISSARRAAGDLKRPPRQAKAGGLLDA